MHALLHEDRVRVFLERPRRAVARRHAVQHRPAERRLALVADGLVDHQVAATGPRGHGGIVAAERVVEPGVGSTQRLVEALPRPVGRVRHRHADALVVAVRPVQRLRRARRRPCCPCSRGSTSRRTAARSGCACRGRPRTPCRAPASATSLCVNGPSGESPTAWATSECVTHALWPSFRGQRE